MTVVVQVQYPNEVGASLVRRNGCLHAVLSCSSSHPTNPTTSHTCRPSPLAHLTPPNTTT
jgi:hypothetical protein